MPALIPGEDEECGDKDQADDGPLDLMGESEADECSDGAREDDEKKTADQVSTCWVALAFLGVWKRKAGQKVFLSFARGGHRRAPRIVERMFGCYCSRLSDPGQEKLP